MEKGILKQGSDEYSVRYTDDMLYPDIDSSWTARKYAGRILIRTNERTLGIKPWATMPSNMQGMAIYGNLLVRMANTGSSTTHYIYQITASGNLTQLATFTLSTSGHSNSLQFAPAIESGQTYPYLYVSEINGSCVVLSIGSDYSVTQVQSISAPGASNFQVGDDGYLWGFNRSNGHLRFIRYRKVSVSEGAVVSLTEADVLEDWLSDEVFSNPPYVSQGMKVKFGKMWLPFGMTGSGQERCIVVYDLTARRMDALVDLTDYANFEPEDLDFWNDSMILCTYAAANFILRF